MKAIDKSGDANPPKDIMDLNLITYNSDTYSLRCKKLRKTRIDHFRNNLKYTGSLIKITQIKIKEIK